MKKQTIIIDGKEFDVYCSEFSVQVAPDSDVKTSATFAGGKFAFCGSFDFDEIDYWRTQLNNGNITGNYDGFVSDIFG